MAQHRELQPVTVYLQPAMKAKLDLAARDKGLNISTFIRLILIENLADWLR